MTLQEAINEVCDAVDIDRITGIYGNNDPSASTMRELAQEAGEEIARRADWQGLLSSFAIAGSATSLPADFQRVVPGGGVRAADGSFVRPVTNSGQWALIKQISSAQAFYFISANKIMISPPAAGVGATLDYLADTWVVPNVGARKDAFGADDDSFIFPGRLIVKNVIWRWRRLKGLAYDDQLAEFEADLAQENTADRGAA